MKRKSLKDFIKENREELDQCIKNALKDQDFRLNDSERRLWIANDESLYNWAKSEGVKI